MWPGHSHALTQQVPPEAISLNVCCNNPTTEAREKEDTHPSVGGNFHGCDQGISPWRRRIVLRMFQFWFKNGQGSKENFTQSA